jgi:large subunit ribosomal protein L28
MTGREPGFGSNVSCSHRRTARRWDPRNEHRKAIVACHAERRAELRR